MIYAENSSSSSSNNNNNNNNNNFFVKYVNLNSFIATDNNLGQHLQFSCPKLNIKRNKNRTDTKKLSAINCYNFKVRLNHEE